MRIRKYISLILGLLILLTALPVYAISPTEDAPAAVENAIQVIEAEEKPPEGPTREEKEEISEEVEADDKNEKNSEGLELAGEEVSQSENPEEGEAGEEKPKESLPENESESGESQEDKNNQDLTAAEEAVKKLEETESSSDEILDITNNAKDLVAALEDSDKKSELQDRINKQDATLKRVTLFWTYQGKENSYLALDTENNIGNRNAFGFNLPENTIAEDFKKSRAEFVSTNVEAEVKVVSKREIPTTNTLIYTIDVTSKDGLKKIRYRANLKIINPEISKDQILNNIISDLSEHYKGTYEDWSAMELAALGRKSYVDEVSLIARAKEIAQKKNSSTDLERITISLTSLGYDVTKFSNSSGKNINLIEEIANFRGGEYGADLGTLNGYIFALIAYDSGSYEIPTGSKWTREKTIDYILRNQSSDKGWDLNNSGKGDTDITAMTIQALAPYYKSNSRVKNAVDGALDFLSNKQIKSGIYAGAFDGFGVGANSNSTAMVIVALNNLGIDADKDTRFIKSGKSVLDGLLLFKTEDNHFGYTTNYSKNGLATEQSFRAVIGYKSNKNVYMFPKPTKSLSTVLTPVSIEIISRPKTEYFVGDLVDISGLTVKVNWSDGSSSYPSTSELELQGLDTITSGNKLVTIKYKGLSDSFWVYVKDQITNPMDPNQPIDPNQPVDPNQPQQPNQPGQSIAYISVVVPPGPTVMTSGRTMFAKSSFPIIEGSDTAFSMLQKTGLSYNYNSHTSYEGVYVSAIEGLAEFDGGPESGWMYRVNGNFPSFSSSLYKVKSGDYVEWLYTRDLGRDVGGYIEGIENKGPEAEKTYKLLATATEGGIIAPSGNVTITTKKPITFKLIPDKGFVIFDLTINGVSKGPLSEFTATVDNIEDNSTIHGVFKKEDQLTEAEKQKLEEQKAQLEKQEQEGQKTNLQGASFENFTDVEGHWAYDYIKYVFDKGYFKGTSETKFEPDSNMTRGMFVTVLGRMSGEEILDSNTKFSDVKEDQYYAKYIKWASDNNIVEGTGGDKFEPDREVNREEMAKMIAAYLKYKNIDISNDSEIEILDEDGISAWAKESVRLMYGKGILKGKTDGKFHPKDLSTRGEVATIIYRISNIN